MMFHHSTVPQVWCQKHLPYGSYHEFITTHLAHPTGIHSTVKYVVAWL